MTEPVYEYIKGKGWVVQSARTFNWKDFKTYQYDDYVCTLCGNPLKSHRAFGDDSNNFVCMDGGPVGLFLPPG